MKRRGAALILVLGAVSILTVLAVSLAGRASMDTLRSARSLRDGSFRRLVDSGAEYARGLLLEREPRGFVFWGDAWNAERTVRLTDDEAADIRMADESGKVNLALAWRGVGDRAAIRMLTDRVFEYLTRRTPRESRALGARRDRVQKRLSSPEVLMTLDGLREAGLSREEIFGPAGLHRFFTCFGDGKINLNTAPRAVLFALDDGFDEALVDRVAAFRGSGEGGKGTYRPFEDPKDLMLIDGIVVRRFEEGQFRVVRNLFERVQGILAVTSTAFSARVSAEARGRRRDAWVFMKPDTTLLAVEEVVP
jgi:hypothetical protein